MRPGKLPATGKLSVLLAMSYRTYTAGVRKADKPLLWLHGEVYHLDVGAVVILDVFSKTSRATPDSVMTSCRKRLRNYLVAVRDKETKR